MSDTQKWVPVVGYEELYEITISGDVRRRAAGDKPPGAPLSRQVSRGYPAVHLSLPGRGQKMLRLHRAVMEAFGPPAPAPSMFVLHNDDDRSNFALSNLRWGTVRDNAADAVKNGGSTKIALWRRQLTHCKRGHEFTEANTLIKRGSTGHQHRRCRRCHADVEAARKATRASA